MRLNISTKDLVVGVYITDLGRPWYKTSYLRNQFKVTSRNEVEKLKDQYSEVEIDIQKSELTTRNAQYLAARYYQIEEFLLAEIEKMADYFALIVRDIKKSSLVYDRKAQKEIARRVDNLVKLPMVPELMERYLADNDELLNKTMRVLVLTLAFAKHITLPKKKLESLALAALFHDVGMALIPQAMLKKSRLSSEEKTTIEQHVEFSCNIVSQLPSASSDVLNIIQTHHENADGSGYPNRLNTRQLTIEAKLFRIVTMFEAMTRDRVYRQKLSQIDALEELFNLSKNRTLPAVMTLKFIDMLALYPTGVPVKLLKDQDAFILRDNFVLQKTDSDVLLIQLVEEGNPVKTITRSDIKCVNYHVV